MAPKPIPVIILQYGKFELTEASIQSVRAQSIPVEIILVDSNSPGKSEEILAKVGALADRQIFLEENVGYGAANNVAIRELLQADSEYFFILNNDTLVESGTLAELVTFMEAHPHAGQVCPMVCYPEGVLQAAGGKVRQDLLEPQLIGHREDVKLHQQPAQVGYAPGMAILVRTAAVREVGLISEDYFMYAEDVDWSFNFLKKDWEIWYCPTARIIHYDSAGTGVFSQKKALYMTRANVWLAKKWLSAPEYKQFLRNFQKKLLRQSIKFAKHPAYVKGMWQGYREGKA